MDRVSVLIEYADGTTEAIIGTAGKKEVAYLRNEVIVTLDVDTHIGKNRNGRD